MKIEVVSREFIKPYHSTPPSLRDYNISLIDELSLAMYIPIVLYYSNDNLSSSSRCDHLKRSLSKVLTRFYPFAGRYIKESFMVDCSDQGAEFVEAIVDVGLHDFIGQTKNMKMELLNCLFPRPVGAGDEATHPLLAVQVSAFACGGWATVVLTSHRIADMSTSSTFVNEWAINAKQLLEGSDENHDIPIMSPSWTSASLFPGKKDSGLPLGLSGAKENIEDHKVVTKVFFFNKSSISRIREMARLDKFSETLPTRVQSVFGIIGKAIIDIHVADSGTSKGFLVNQAVNMRERTDPPIPKNQCGNLFLVSTAHIVAGKRSVEFQSIVDLLTRAVGREVENCKMILSVGGQMIITNGLNELTKTLAKPEIACNLVFTDWCKFPFYEADFGLGKPVWASGINSPLGNIVCLFNDKFGEGIEAWVSLNANDMHKFELDPNIMEFSS
ncbi:Pelargonidin 3-o-(6-caffeoylglucoside) 5-o-(6-o-malonylglucoside) 4'''-malonyltransferase [Heracleum sosnowskyi]|uniref:Pelargonidin 3-o-(6-caffeoylglucoside) 5-o-(6-o-malonylglucoside) 4'''-malonyltransferase n=1 Tax=Heracleum sosnowskyi TaxID=360622 RepID=A0AAD8MSR5_9APIA|nr:Pelargonidin 3-o-(6-caffeoylglucoside) 5-o-(6-o-malonylglucoside) 4'''-malonyltransferase [Heracleum sosnowskyi]